MHRDGPGFLIDLFYVWLVVVVCVVVTDSLARLIGRPIGLVVGITASILVVFLFFLAYYRIYLDERPLLGTVSRTQIGILSFQVVIVGFVIAALVAGPDPWIQTAVAAVVILLGIAGSYWWVYHRNAPHPVVQ